MTVISIMESTAWIDENDEVYADLQNLSLIESQVWSSSSSSSSSSSLFSDCDLIQPSLSSVYETAASFLVSSQIEDDIVTKVSMNETESLPTSLTDFVTSYADEVLSSSTGLHSPLPSSPLTNVVTHVAGFFSAKSESNISSSSSLYYDEVDLSENSSSAVYDTLSSFPSNETYFSVEDEFLFHSSSASSSISWWWDKAASSITSSSSSYSSSSSSLSFFPSPSSSYYYSSPSFGAHPASSSLDWWLDWLPPVNVTEEPSDFLDGEIGGGGGIANLTNLTMVSGGCILFGNGTSSSECPPVPPYEFDPGVVVTTTLLTPTTTTSTDLTGSLDQQYWALLLILFPLFTIFGNVLVILSVYKERNLQTVTNYFIVSLAVADLLVAALVMPFAVYVLVNVNWDLSPTLCDFYIAMDVTCSTSSIFNLVAISIDRFIAVTRPIKYAKHKNSGRVAMTIAIVWLVSAAIGTPIVLGLNTTPNRDPSLCIFYNSDFIIFSSLSSFYIPCIIMVLLYYRIFKVIRERAKKSAAAKRAHAVNVVDTVIENVAHSKRLPGGGGGGGAHHTCKTLCRYKETVTLCVSLEPDGPTANTESGSQENEDDEGELEEKLSNTGCHVVNNDRSSEFILGPVVTDDGRSSSTVHTSSTLTPSIRSSPPPLPPPQPPTTLLLLHRDPTSNGGNRDSGYGPSQMEETPFHGDIPIIRRDSCLDEPHRNPPLERHPKGSKRNGTLRNPSGSVRSTSELTASLGRTGSVSPSRRKRPRFHLARSHKSSRKKREKSAAKKERKATKTLAIVLGVFLVCWMPFFTCNILDAICIKLNEPSWQPGFTAFVFTTWLGYMNSFINPVIYTIFNPEFRKAFKKILFGN